MSHIQQLNEVEGALAAMILSNLVAFIMGALAMAYFFEIWC